MTNSDTRALILNLLQTLTLHRDALEAQFEAAELSAESIDSMILDLTTIAKTQQETTDTDTPSWLRVVGPKVSVKVLKLDGTSEDLDLEGTTDTQPTQQEENTNA